MYFSSPLLPLKFTDDMRCFSSLVYKNNPLFEKSVRDAASLVKYISWDTVPMIFGSWCPYHLPMTSYTSWDQILCLRECNKLYSKVVLPCDKINPKDVKCDNDHPLNFEDEGFHDNFADLSCMFALFHRYNIYYIYVTDIWYRNSKLRHIIWITSHNFNCVMNTLELVLFV